MMWTLCLLTACSVFRLSQLWNVMCRHFTIIDLRYFLVASETAWHCITVFNHLCKAMPSFSVFWHYTFSATGGTARVKYHYIRKNLVSFVIVFHCHRHHRFISICLVDVWQTSFASWTSRRPTSAMFTRHSDIWIVAVYEDEHEWTISLPHRTVAILWQRLCVSLRAEVRLTPLLISSRYVKRCSLMLAL